MFTSALRSAEAETSSAAALTDAVGGIGVGTATETGAGFSDASAVGTAADAVTFFFSVGDAPPCKTDVSVVTGVASDKDIVVMPSEEGGRGKPDVSKNSGEVAGVFVMKEGNTT